MLSPKPDHKNYHRFKYYSALRTGYGHLGIEQPALEPPTHIIDPNLFLFKLPFCKFKNIRIADRNSARLQAIKHE